MPNYHHDSKPVFDERELWAERRSQARPRAQRLQRRRLDPGGPGRNRSTTLWKLVDSVVGGGAKKDRQHAARDGVVDLWDHGPVPGID